MLGCMHGCCVAHGINGLLARNMGYVGLPPTGWPGSP